MKTVAFLLTSLLMTMASSEAGAHAFLDHAAPAVGSVIHGSPSQVSLWFTQALEPAFSTVRVLDRNGRQVDKQDKHVDRANAGCCRCRSRSFLPGGIAWYGGRSRSTPTSPRAISFSMSHLDRWRQTNGLAIDERIPRPGPRD